MKGKRTDLSQQPCGIARSLQVIGDWWSLLIVREAFGGKERFGEFQKSLGLAKNILASRLRKLVDEGIFAIEADPSTAQSHRYVLTAKGQDLYLVLVSLWQWGEGHCFAPGELPYQFVDRSSGQPIRKLELRAQDGRVLGSKDYRLAALKNRPEQSAHHPGE